MPGRNCQCPTCRGARRAEYEEEATFSARAGESPFSEAEENELAMELLSVSSEEELDQFLGKLIKGVGFGSRQDRGAARRRTQRVHEEGSLPFVGGALGSFIPIPGVGTAVGSALGSAVSKALEAELVGLELEEQDFEMARRFVCALPERRRRRQPTRQHLPTHKPPCALLCSARRGMICRNSTARAQAAGCGVVTRSSSSAREPLRRRPIMTRTDFDIEPFTFRDMPPPRFRTRRPGRHRRPERYEFETGSIHRITRQHADAAPGFARLGGHRPASPARHGWLQCGHG